MRRIHYFSGITISVFVALHLFNHFTGIWGAEKHIEVMNTLRHFYRNIFAETVLLIAVAVQIYTGLVLFKANRKLAASFFEKVHVWSGLYLAGFLVIHLSAVFAGRLFLQLDTNFYFGVAGLNSFPVNLFFIPYYGFAILSFFGHVSAIHSKKMKHRILGITPIGQSCFILLFGAMLTLVIFYGLTNRFKGVSIPTPYHVLIGK